MEIETDSRKLIDDMFKNEKGKYEVKSFKEGASVRYENSVEQLSAGVTEVIINLTIELSREVAIAIVAAWIYDKMIKNGRIKSFAIGKKQVILTLNEIHKSLTEIWHRKNIQRPKPILKK